MMKYVFAASLLLPSIAFGADYIEGPATHHHRQRQICHLEQSGATYCVEAPPIEKLTTNCDAGVDCHHMQSGQHYSVQRPIVVD